MTQEINKLLDKFQVTIPQLQRLTAVALANGGDYADIFFEDKGSSNMTLFDSKVKLASTTSGYGVGIRVISGEKCGYAYTESPSWNEMVNAAKTASCIASSISKATTAKVEPIQHNNFYPIKIDPATYPTKEKIQYLQRLNDKIFSLDNRVATVLCSIRHSISNVLFFNSLGNIFADSRPHITISSSCVMQSGNRKENGGCSRSFMMGAELLTEEILNEVAIETVERASFQMRATRPKGGLMPVVMGAGASGILLHEAIGHCFEADFCRKGQSIFCDKLGKQICDKSISVIDDGTIPLNRGSVNVDDEGVLGQKTYMVKDGVLNSFLHDRISAKYYGVEPTGNGRRQSFRYMPIPRMRATYMENGEYTKEELIKGIKKGIYVDDFSNGEVQIGEGNFTFYVRAGHLIEDGHLTQEIKDINVMGNGPMTLAKIDAVANDCTIDNSQWNCGKGQDMAVSCGMPSVRVTELLVGGIE